MKPDSKVGDLKILIVSTPRTGNTWLKLLLSRVYDLPVVDLPVMFDPSQVDTLGHHWIGHQHYSLSPDLIAWAKQHRAVILTTIRHPGDTLVSWFHYIRNKLDAPASIVRLAPMMALDGDRIGCNTVRYAQIDFFNMLNYSFEWMLSGGSWVIRYEDLWRYPISVLTHLTSRIYPVTADCIERAVDMCEIGMLRWQFDPGARFFRSGQVGEWRTALPSEIVDIFRLVEPYPNQFALMGYTLDPKDPLIDAPPTPRPRRNPFHDASNFDNGVLIPPVVAHLYWSVEHCYERWPQPQITDGADSFFAWVNVPAEADPSKGSLPLITNLAAFAYRIRPDVQQAFPDPFGQDRSALAAWFLNHARLEYNLPEALLNPVRQSMG